jgi:hypothetical protein
MALELFDHGGRYVSEAGTTYRWNLAFRRGWTNHDGLFGFFFANLLESDGPWTWSPKYSPFRDDKPGRRLLGTWTAKFNAEPAIVEMGRHYDVGTIRNALRFPFSYDYNNEKFLKTKGESYRKRIRQEEQPVALQVGFVSPEELRRLIHEANHA